jgi:type II secretory pathway component GspD/PulD (secretin)
MIGHKAGTIFGLQRRGNRGVGISLVPLLISISLVNGILGSNPALAQAVVGDLQPTDSSSGMVQLNFEGDIEIKDLIDLVSKRLGVNILYDEQILNKKVNIRSPQEVRPESLLGLLQSALQMKDLALRSTGTEGWHQVVPTAKLPAAEVQIEFITLRYTVLAEIGEQVEKLLEGRKQSSLVQAAQGAPPSKNRVTADERTNQLILTGTRSEIVSAMKLIQKLDVPPQVTTKVYRMRHVSAERIDDVMNDLFDPEKGDRRYRAAVEAEANKLFVTATPEQHKKIGALVKSLDVPPPEDQGHIQL